jgi:hypothetical protein
MKIEAKDILYNGENLIFAPGVLQFIKRKFWDKDVDNEVRKMEQWLLVNKEKKRYNVFVIKWLMRANIKTNRPDEFPGRDRVKKSEPKLFDVNTPYNPNL